MITEETGRLATTDELQKFCSIDEKRAASIGRPFAAEDGFTYATDDRIIVRGPSSEFPAEANEKAPKLTGIYQIAPWNHNELDQGALLDFKESVLPAPDFVECAACKGSGKIANCTGCNGSGECECLCGDIHACGECDGTGGKGGKGDESAKCDVCDGSGKQEKAKPIPVGKAYINVRYLKMIRDLPGARMFSAQNPEEPVPFIFHCGTGYVMPMRIQ